MDFGPVWAQLCFAAAGGALWDCWLWKRADFGKTRAQTLPGFAKFCFQHANHRLRSLGAKGFSPLQKLKKKISVCFCSPWKILIVLWKEKTLGKTKLGYSKESGVFLGKEESVFLWSLTTLENNHPLNTFFFACFVLKTIV